MSIASEISRLQTAKADLKISIEGKGVTVPSSATLDDYPDLVDAIEAGVESELEEFAGEVILVANHSQVQTVSIKASNCYKLDGSNVNYIKDLYVDFPEGTRVRFVRATIETFTFKNKVGVFNNQAFAYNSNLKGVYGYIVMPDDVKLTAYMFANCYNLQHIRFEKSSINIQPDATMFNNARSLSDESIVSIANGLDETQTGYTIKLEATPKARCSVITGIVSDGEFVIDENGSMTLDSFIANVKGWTLA